MYDLSITSELDVLAVLWQEERDILFGLIPK